jgi:hypothetical protein
VPPGGRSFRLRCTPAAVSTSSQIWRKSYAKRGTSAETFGCRQRTGTAILQIANARELPRGDFAAARFFNQCARGWCNRIY